MRIPRSLLAFAILISYPLARSWAQTPPPPPSVSVTPGIGGPATVYHAIAQNFPPDIFATTALFDPSGNQTVQDLRFDASGSLRQTLPPPGGHWQIGVYRWVVALANGKSWSTIFAVNDGAPHLYESPFSPSPNSAFEFAGVGLPPQAQIDLTGLFSSQGQFPFHATTNADGTFDIFVFPQEMGFPFFAAGDYRLEAPALQLSVSWRVREHPNSAMISVGDSPQPNGLMNITLQNYVPHRYVWGLYADTKGTPVGEFLFGLTDVRGGLQTALLIPDLAPGQYYLASPYDWGETSFMVQAPLPTFTPTVTSTASPASGAHAVKAKASRCITRVSGKYGRCARATRFTRYVAVGDFSTRR